MSRTWCPRRKSISRYNYLPRTHPASLLPSLGPGRACLIDQGEVGSSESAPPLSSSSWGPVGAFVIDEPMADGGCRPITGAADATRWRDWGGHCRRCPFFRACSRPRHGPGTGPSTGIGTPVRRRRAGQDDGQDRQARRQADQGQRLREDEPTRGPRPWTCQRARQQPRQ